MIHNGIEYTQIPYAPTYYISRCGKVVSLKDGCIRNVGISKTKKGYYVCNLVDINNCRRICKVHRLVANTFLGLDLISNAGRCDIHINHIDMNKSNNHVINLEIISLCENVRHYSINTTPILIGVHIHPLSKKYFSRICVSGKRHYLGGHKTPEQAHKAYIDAFIRYGLRDKYIEQLPAYKEAMMLKGVGASIV